MLLARHEESTSSNPQSGASTTASASIEPPPDTGLVTTVLAPGTMTAPTPPTSMTLPTVIAIPAYFGPVPLWDLMLNAVRSAEPSAPRIVLAVMNPASGPGAVADTGYLRVLEDARALGIRVFGYVATGYGTRFTVLDDIAAYQRFYGITDIFFDESPIECLWLQSVYAPWLAAVHANGGQAVVNPGRPPERCWADAADIVVTFEGSFWAYATHLPPPWMAAFEPSKFWNIVYAVPTESLATVSQLPAGRGSGLLYATDDVLPNPYDNLPAALSVTTTPTLTLPIPALPIPTFPIPDAVVTVSTSSVMLGPSPPFSTP